MVRPVIHKFNFNIFFVLLFTLSATNFALSQETYRMGPSGGLGGNRFYDSNIPSNSRVREVVVRNGSWIDAIQIIHEIPGRGSMRFRSHGGEGGRVSRFTLNNDEYIKAIEGRYGRFVDSIRIYTNRRSSARYGGTGGTVSYYYEAPAGFEIVGFHGHSGRYVDSIGVIMRRRR